MPPTRDARPLRPAKRLARVALGLALGVALIVGCQLGPQPAPHANEAGVVRGQSPETAHAGAAGDGAARVASAPWGATYLAPGEISCDTPPPLGVGYQVAPMPPLVYFEPGPATSAPAAGPPEASWLDVLPPEGGPISQDFGLPRSATVDDRLPNPIYVPASNPDAAWEALAAIVARYFPIRSEQRVQQLGTVASEGRIETQWQSGATVFEPWRRDSVGAFNRWQSTLQTIRRRAVVSVLPAASGYEVGVRVDKQLEDLNRPERASAGGASIRADGSLPTDRVTPVDPIRDSGRWMDIGRDEPLEQRMLAEVQRRFTAGR